MNLKRPIVMGVGAAIASFTLLAGCGQAAESAVENATGTDIEVSEGGDSLTITSEEGEEYEVTTGAAVEIPAALPADFPLPDDPNAKLISAVETGEGFTLAWEWTGLTKDTFEAYLDTVEAAGYASTERPAFPDMGPDAFQSGGQFTGQGLSMSIVGFADASMGQMSLTALPDK